MRKNKVKFNLTNRKTPNPLIRVIYRYKPTPLDWSTGLNCSLEDWACFDEYTQRFDPRLNKKQQRKFELLNNDLNLIETTIYKIEDKYKNLDKFNDLSTELFKSLLNRDLKGIEIKENKTSFVWFAQYMIDNPKSFNLSEGTIINYVQFLKSFKRFIEHYKYNDIAFDDIDLLFFDNMINYFATEGGHQASTIKTRVGYFKSILRKAFKRKYHKNLDFENFEIKEGKRTKKKYAYLNFEELQLFESVDLKNMKEPFHQVKDIFLCLCYVGCRVSDYQKINRKNIKEINGTIQFNELGFETQKKGTYILQPLTAKLNKILDRYPDGLPYYERTLMNYYIKQIGEMAGIDKEHADTQTKGNIRRSHRPKWELLSPHSARRTFATHRKIEGYSDFEIMQMMGITQIDTLYGYFVESEIEISISNARKMLKVV